MDIDLLKELTNDEILARFQKKDRWKLEDMLLFAFGYEHEDVFWDIILDGNRFPSRHLGTALQATNEINPKIRLSYVSKIIDKAGFEICHVKKGPFLQWAIKRWPQEQRVKRVFTLWKKYKGLTESASPASLTPQARIRNYGDKIQIQEYIAHCKADSPKPYRANISEIAKQVKQALKDIPFTHNTFKTYIKRMKPAELAQQAG